MLLSASRVVGSLALLALMASCGGDEASTTGRGLDGGTPRDASAGNDAGTGADAGDGIGKRLTKANVLFILADDLSWNLVEHMPNVQKMQTEGVTFENYFVTDSLCCPSRSSILTGRFPHNTGVFSNEGDDGGYAAFKAHGNEPHTYGVALQGAGYTTGFMGKYMNGYLPAMPIPPGWSHWAVTGNGYPEFNYQLHDDSQIVSHGSDPADYLTDVLSSHGAAFLDDAAKKPFSLEIATFAPHGDVSTGLAVPAPRDADLYPNLKAPHGPAYDAAPDADAVAWLKAAAQLGIDPAKLNNQFRHRAQSVKAVDDMIGALRKKLADLGLDKTTYVIFSSDNGFHLGEHRLHGGKLTAFDTDIRVPLIVVGPGISPGRKVAAVTENIDLCPTFADLANVPPLATADGRSLVPLFLGEAPADWRNGALVEHHGDDFADGDPDTPEEGNENPPSYQALRTTSYLYVEYAANPKKGYPADFEYHDYATDPDELKNTFSALGAPRKQALHAAVTAMAACKGDPACWTAQHAP